MKMKKALVALVCAIALVTATFLGTMAYFTSQDSVTNTFTVGKVKIDLDEAKVNLDGTLVENADRVKENKYHLIPGMTYIKDPTVTVEEKSEESYIYMTVNVKDFGKLTSALPVATYPSYYANNIFLIQNLCDWQADSIWNYEGFKQYTDADGIVWGEYRFVYNSGAKVAGGENGNELAPLFGKIHVPGEDFNNDNIKNLENVEIVVKAYASQATGFSDYNAAWSATFGDNTNYTIQ